MSNLQFNSDYIKRKRRKGGSNVIKMKILGTLLIFGSIIFIYYLGVIKNKNKPLLIAICLKDIFAGIVLILMKGLQN